MASDGQLKFPAWQGPLQEVILEFDGAKLREKIKHVETLLDKRLEQLGRGNGGHPERQAIQDALDILRVVKRDKLGVSD